MTIAGLPDSFASVAEADAINTSSTWSAAATASKEAALQWATLYLYRTYSFNFEIDAPPEVVKTANSMLASYHLSEDLFVTARNAAPQKGLQQQSVEAKGVKSSRTYNTSRSNSWVDPFPEVTALLLHDGDASLAKITGGISFVPLTRR